MAEEAGAIVKPPEEIVEEVKGLGKELRQILEEKGESAGVGDLLGTSVMLEALGEPKKRNFLLFSWPRQEKEGKKITYKIVSIQGLTPGLRSPVKGAREDILEIDRYIRTGRESKKGTWKLGKPFNQHFYFNTQTGELFNGNQKALVKPKKAKRILTEIRDHFATE